MLSSTLRRYDDLGILILRIVIGAIFIYHGSAKFSILTGTPEGIGSSTLWIMRILAIAEPLGGLALILGLLADWAALGLAIIMAGAIVMKIAFWGIGFSVQQGMGWEFDLILLAANLLLLMHGSGSLTLARIFKGSSQQAYTA